MSLELRSGVRQRLKEVGPATSATELEERLGALGENPFTAARTTRFTNTDQEVREWLGAMASLLAGQIQLRFMYVEMNGFDINYDSWFCSAFGYDRDIDFNAEYKYGLLDELSGYGASVHFREDLTLRGMEPMQEAFRWYMEDVEDRSLFAEAQQMAELLVECRFLAALQAGCAYGSIAPDVPVSAATHDSDLVLRFEPPGVSA